MSASQFLSELKIMNFIYFYFLLHLFSYLDLELELSVMLYNHMI